MAGGGWSRWLALRRSAPIALVLLVAANLVPLFGVLFLGWDIVAILVIYWIENGIVGALNAVRMMLAARGDPVRGAGPLAGRLGLAAFFTFHYGIFWIVHGVFVVLLTQGFARLGPDDPPGLLASAIGRLVSDPRVVLGALALFASHAASLVFNYVGRREYLAVSPGSQMLIPYARMVALHLAIVLGAAAVIDRGRPLILIVVLVVAKTIGDLILHLVERARYQRAAAGDG